jgi:hypothetical protein
VYNLSISGLHTFFIGRDKLLVHNCNPSELIKNAESSAKVQSQTDPFHSFDPSVFDSAGPENVSVETGGDQQTYTHIRMPGQLTTPSGSVYEGTYEVTIDQTNTITHYFFNPA